MKTIKKDCYARKKLNNGVEIEFNLGNKSMSLFKIIDKRLLKLKDTCKKIITFSNRRDVNSISNYGNIIISGLFILVGLMR